MIHLLMLVPVLLMFIHQSIFARYLSPTIAYEMAAASRILAGQMPYSQFYFDDLPTRACLRVPEVWLGDILQSPTLAPLSLWLAGPSGGVVGALPCATGLLLSHLLWTFVIECISLMLCYRLVASSGLKDRALLSCRILVMSFAVAQLSSGFATGCTQHLAFLLLMPMLTLTAVQFYDGKASGATKLIANLSCGLAGALSYALLPLPLILCLVRLSVLSWRKSIDKYSILCLFGSLASLSTLLLISHAAWTELTGWIIPLKKTALDFENMLTYGTDISPDRRELVYALSVAIVLAGGMRKHRGVLIPPVVCGVYGFAIFICSMQLVSDNAGLLTLSAVTALFYQIVLALYQIGDHYPRLVLGKSQLLKRSAVVLGLLLSCPYLFGKEFFELRRVKSAAANAPGLGYTQREDMRPAILRFSKPGESIVIFSGRATPGCSEALLTGRKVGGYFLSYEPFGSLNSMLKRHADGLWIGQPKEFFKDLEVKLPEQLLSDLDAQKPAIVMVEGGEMDMMLKTQNWYSRILDHYYQGEFAQYFSTNEGPREYIDWNYDFAVLRK